MENNEFLGSSKQDSPEELPSLFQNITSHSVPGFDNIGNSGGLNYPYQPTVTPTNNPSPNHTSVKVTEASAFPSCAYSSMDCLPKSSLQAIDPHRLHSISISMPSSPAGLQLEGTKRGLFSDKGGTNFNHETTHLQENSSVSNTRQPKQAKFHSQPIPAGHAYAKAVTEVKLPPNPLEQPQMNLRNNRAKDKCYDSFKTWSGRLERQLSNLSRKHQEAEAEINSTQIAEIEVLPVDRYYDALEGPELDTLRTSEELVLPEDKQWPFLLRFPMSSFGICLGFNSQAILWKTLAISPATRFLHISPTINLVLWCISVVVMAIISSIYSLKLVFYFEAVRREYHHPIRVNFFFAPWIAFLLLALGVPPVVTENLPATLWYVLMAPILFLELKIYGQWMLGGQRRLSKVANPSNHLSIVGNFVGALLGTSLGLKEGPIFFFAVGLAHYTVLFVTLYQRLPTNETLPKELHPVFFFFVAAPSVASMSWATIQGGFDYGARIAYFIALFLYVSLAVRVNFFRGFRFSLAWWAYTFPMTAASIATIKYSNAVKNPLTQSLSIVLSAISTLTVTALLVSTIVHAFVLRNLFPNDITIAITGRRPKGSKKRSHLRTTSSDAKDIETSDEMSMQGF
ncbi:S-type anion channel SLAH2-like isoform X2 [Magnolia sinica]|nr:S-type anion channel SLAH2-like isoform X2 [Magnolia sinica]XP_058096106.1 S-type anion channel SLAH2-like isoform X2 [Magnolia sinica]XP_058096107.1 S-type anion channel SLAH2-like isoform X2 [Magnolia sinica]